MVRCCDCRKYTHLRARGRCSPCYGRFYHSRTFELLRPQSSQRHRLSAVDADARTGICSRCGPVRVTRCPDRHGRDSFRCNTTRNRQKRDLRARAKVFPVETV